MGMFLAWRRFRESMTLRAPAESMSGSTVPEEFESEFRGPPDETESNSEDREAREAAFAYLTDQGTIKGVEDKLRHGYFALTKLYTDDLYTRLAYARARMPDLDRTDFDHVFTLLQR